VRRHLSRILALGSLVVPLAAAGGLLVARAQTPINITMMPTGEPNLTGTSQITVMSPTQVKVDVTVNGLKPNDDRASHIHSPGSGTGACDTGGPVVYPLSDVKADASGKGTASTVITLDPAKGIPTKGWYVNVHQGAPPNVGNGVICGPIAAALTGGAATTGAAATAAPGAAAPAGGPGNLPGSGDAVPTPMLLGALALAGVLLVGVGFAVGRRRA